MPRATTVYRLREVPFILRNSFCPRRRRVFRFLGQERHRCRLGGHRASHQRWQPRHREQRHPSAPSEHRHLEGAARHTASLREVSAAAVASSPGSEEGFGLAHVAMETVGTWMMRGGKFPGKIGAHCTLCSPIQSHRDHLRKSKARQTDGLSHGHSQAVGPTAPRRWEEGGQEASRK